MEPDRASFLFLAAFTNFLNNLSKKGPVPSAFKINSRHKDKKL